MGLRDVFTLAPHSPLPRTPRFQSNLAISGLPFESNQKARDCMDAPNLNFNPDSLPGLKLRLVTPCNLSIASSDDTANSELAKNHWTLRVQGKE